MMPKGPLCRLEVRGLPVPQGSMNIYRGRAIHSKSTALKQWRALIALEAKQQLKTPIKATPLTVYYDFFLPRPKTVPQTRRPLPAVKPDLDKLVRAVNDALATDAGLIDEDSRIVTIRASKRYADQTPPGVKVTIWGAQC